MRAGTAGSTANASSHGQRCRSNATGDAGDDDAGDRERDARCGARPARSRAPSSAAAGRDEDEAGDADAGRAAGEEHRDPETPEGAADKAESHLSRAARSCRSNLGRARARLPLVPAEHDVRILRCCVAAPWMGIFPLGEISEVLMEPGVASG